MKLKYFFFLSFFVSISFLSYSMFDLQLAIDNLDIKKFEKLLAKKEFLTQEEKNILIKEIDHQIIIWQKKYESFLPCFRDFLRITSGSIISGLATLGAAITYLISEPQESISNFSRRYNSNKSDFFHGTTFSLLALAGFGLYQSYTGFEHKSAYNHLCRARKIKELILSKKVKINLKYFF